MVTAMLNHSPIGASSYKRVASCPGSMKLSELCESTTSESAARGTRLHEVAARMLEGDPATDFADGADIDAVSTYVDYCKGICRELMCEPIIEQRYSLPHESNLLFGTIDFAAYQELQRLVIVDYKSGRMPVNPVDNSQLLYYATMLWETLPDDIKTLIPEVELTIVQPEDGGIKTWMTTPARLVDFRTELYKTLEVALSNNAPLVVGTQCKYCPAKALCSAYKDDLEQRSQIKLENISGMRIPNTANVIELRYEYVDEWRAYLDAIEGQAIALATKGYKFEHFESVERLGNRSWTDEKVAAGILTQTMGDVAFSRKLQSPTQIMAIVDKQTKEMAKKATIKEPVISLLHLKEELEPLITRKSLGLKLQRRGNTDE